MIVEHAVIPNLMLARRRHEVDETREEGFGLEHDMGRARAHRTFEGEQDAAIGKPGDGIVSPSGGTCPVETLAING